MERGKGNLDLGDGTSCLNHWVSQQHVSFPGKLGLPQTPQVLSGFNIATKNAFHIKWSDGKILKQVRPPTWTMCVGCESDVISVIFKMRKHSDHNTSEPEKGLTHTGCFTNVISVIFQWKGWLFRSSLLLPASWQMPFNDWHLQMNLAVTTLPHNANSAFPQTVWFCTHFMCLESLLKPHKPFDGKQKQSTLLTAEDFRHHQTT